jgi:hypothetical protein
MKWLTPLLPYLAVALGLFWLHHAWLALLGFHFAIVISLLLAKPSIPVKILFTSRDLRWCALSILLCGSSGFSLYSFWSYFGFVSNLPAQVESLGLTSATWPLFITYFVLVNPLIGEYFWRGIWEPHRNLYVSDFLYAGFHELILWNKVPMSSIIYSLIALVLAAWFWRQLARVDQGLLAPVLGHMAADFTVLIAIFWKL